MIDNNKILSVAEYVDLLNEALRQFRARITGEVTEVKVSDRGHVYFTLKDKSQQCVIDCVMWQSNYHLCGVKLKQGLEVILSGFPDIYPPSGRLSFKADTVELKGMGPLKRAYEALKKKLSQEGLFAEERKRPLPWFPQKIGVITSRTGAVIDDFLNNLSQYGFQVKLIDARVEGQEAVREIYSALNQFKKQDIEVLAIMRGGGSLESLQAFNNEALVREVAGFPKPVLAAIGHDKDVPLICLAADVAVSTPTAAATALNSTWDQLARDLPHLSQGLCDSFQVWLERLKDDIARAGQDIAQIFEYGLNEKKQFLKTAIDYLKAVDPRTNLKLGYSIVFGNGGVIKQASQLKEGQQITTQFYKGQARSRVEKISP